MSRESSGAQEAQQPTDTDGDPVADNVLFPDPEVDMASPPSSNQKSRKRVKRVMDSDSDRFVVEVFDSVYLVMKVCIIWQLSP